MDRELHSTELAGLLWTWWRSDPLPSLPPLPDFWVMSSADDAVLSTLSGISAAEIDARRQTYHRPYLAWLNSTPVAYGWSAAGQTQFGHPPVTFRVPAGQRYLMGFATLPEWRGRGIYPRLLQSILRLESGKADRFWILHHRDNTASARGIEKAGFVQAAQIHFLSVGGLGLMGPTTADRLDAGAALLGLPCIE